MTTYNLYKEHIITTTKKLTKVYYKEQNSNTYLKLKSLIADIIDVYNSFTQRIKEDNIVHINVDKDIYISLDCIDLGKLSVSLHIINTEDELVARFDYSYNLKIQKL